MSVTWQVSFPKEGKIAAGLGQGELKRTERSWQPWISGLVLQPPVSSPWRPPHFALGDKQGCRWDREAKERVQVHLSFPLSKNSLSQASSSDNWLMKAQAFALLPNQASWGHNSSWKFSPGRGGQKEEEESGLWRCLWFYCKTLRETEGERANSHHLQKTRGWGQVRTSTGPVTDSPLLLPSGRPFTLSPALLSVKAGVMSARSFNNGSDKYRFWKMCFEEGFYAF